MLISGCHKVSATTGGHFGRQAAKQHITDTPEATFDVTGTCQSSGTHRNSVMRRTRNISVGREIYGDDKGNPEALKFVMGYDVIPVMASRPSTKMSPTIVSI